MDEAKFKSTRLLQDGVIRQIEIIGEAVRHISKDIRNTYPEIPWQDWNDENQAFATAPGGVPNACFVRIKI